MKKNLLIILIIMISSFVVGRSTVSKKVEIKYKEKVVRVTDVEYVRDSNIKKNIKYITRVIYKKDGTKIEEREKIVALESNEKLLQKIAKDGAERARISAQETISGVKELMGLASIF